MGAPRALLAFAALVLAAPPAPAPAAPQPPLRTLIYRVEYASHARLEMRGSGLGNGVDRGAASGTGNETRQFDAVNSGTLRFEVVAATADGGLVIDSALDADHTSQPTIRVAIFPDGRLSFDPSKTLSSEARLLMPLLARDLLAERGPSAGASWNVAWTSPARGSTRYTVTSTEGSRARLRIENEGTLPGGVTERGVAETTYETKLLDPLAYRYRGTVRKEVTTQESESEEITMTATLVSDSFAR